MNIRHGRRWFANLVCALAMSSGGHAAADNVTMTLRDVDIAEVMEMLSRTQRMNILLSEGVEGTISLNLFNMEADEAVYAIANAAGYAVEMRGNTYFIIDREDVGRHADGGVTEVRTYRIQYSDPDQVAEILEDYTSIYGQVTALANRGLLVVQDRPEFIDKIDLLVRALDTEPRQIFIEAQIIEVTLDDSMAYGIDWRRIFDGGDSAVGTRDLAAQNAQGFFLELVTNDVEVFIDALVADGQARTLSSPKLLTLEGEEAEVIVGDRKGYRETTTINQVTTESIKFLESGVILRVIPSVDAAGRILMSVEPEISTGTVQDGIPSQTATAVNTVLLLEDGQTSLIGGLIKRSLTTRKSGVPILRSMPIVGGAFRNKDEFYVNTETIVMITPRIVGPGTRQTILSEHEPTIDQTLEALGGR